MYSGLHYNSIVYEGFLPAAPQATGGETPSSTVLDLNDAIGRLGCSKPQVFLTGRCASTGVTCNIDEQVIRSVSWDRRLDDVSEATVVMELSGTTFFTCCECLAEAEPWCHELHIWRDGVEVWVGPIESIDYEVERVTIHAKDSLAWLGVRIPPVDINFVGGATDLTDQAIFLLETAFAEDGPTYTCELDSIFSSPTGFTFELFHAKFDQTALEILRDIGDAGLDFTTLGRSIVLVGNPEPLTPLVLLSDEHIMGEIKVIKDGTLMANRYYVHFEGDNGIPASGEATDFYCYGPIEKIRDGDGLNNGIDAAAVADEFVQAGGIAPRILEIPEGSQLSPDAPWTINEMVCGARVDVSVTRLCLNITQSFRLTGVEVNYTSDDGEQVGITLTPINSVAVGGPT